MRETAARHEKFSNAPFPFQRSSRFTFSSRNFLKCPDASSSNEAVHLQQRLRSLSTELVTLRNRLHVGQSPDTSTLPPGATTKSSALSTCSEKNSQAPAVPPRTSLSTSNNNNSNTLNRRVITASALIHQSNFNNGKSNTLPRNSTTATNNFLNSEFSNQNAAVLVQNFST